MAKDVTTVEEEDELPSSVSSQSCETLTLCVAFCRTQPWRLGEVLSISGETRGRPSIWGRGAASEAGPHVLLGQHRPGRWLPSPPLNAPAISRQQLSLESIGDAHILVENLGKCPMFRNGKAVARTELAPGDLLRLGKQLLFVCVRRAASSQGWDYPEFPFGGADPNGIVGESPTAWALRRRVAFVAARHDHVLIHGPSGSGKELIARAIHAQSSCAARPMVSRSAATLPQLLIDAELFGNAKNYPNPGMLDRAGLIGEAQGSTLFLDEIAELPQQSQSHLLRVLDGGEYQRLGESKARVSDFRLIAATNREPGSLKDDFLARFGLRFAVPNLSSRLEDVPLLVRHLLEREAARGDAVARRLFPHGIGGSGPDVPLEVIDDLLQARPQDVRALHALLWEKLAARELGTGAAAYGDAAKSELNAVSREPAADEAAKSSGLDAERIQRCLDEHNGVIEQTWRALGLANRFALMRLIRKYDLELRKRAKRPG